MTDADAILIGRAFSIACRAHADQTDKSGAPYIGHVARVAAGVARPPEIVVALLHDVVEDTGVSMATLARQFPEPVLKAVDAITRRPDEAHEAYYKRVAADPLARAVKASDIADNMSPARMAALDPQTQARLSEKYATAQWALGMSSGETP